MTRQKTKFFKKMTTLLAAGAVLTSMSAFTASANNDTPQTYEAVPTNMANQSVWFHNNQVMMQGYLVNGNNYFKLRDLANLLDFSVDYNNGVVSIGERKWSSDTATGYEKQAGEINEIDFNSPMKTNPNASANFHLLSTSPLETENQTAIQSSNTMLYKGEQISPKAYLINGNNYIQLRDLSEYMNSFWVTFDTKDSASYALFPDPTGAETSHVWVLDSLSALSVCAKEWTGQTPVSNSNLDYAIYNIARACPQADTSRVANRLTALNATADQSSVKTEQEKNDVAANAPTEPTENNTPPAPAPATPTITTTGNYQDTSGITEEYAKQVLAQLKEEYPHGSPWGPEMEYGNSKGCAAFADMVSDRIFGKDDSLRYVYLSGRMYADYYADDNPTRKLDLNKYTQYPSARVHQDLSKARVGDIIWTGGHYEVVTEVSPNKDYVLTCSGNGAGKVSWNDALCVDPNTTFKDLRAKYPNELNGIYIWEYDTAPIVKSGNKLVVYTRYMP